MKVLTRKEAGKTRAGRGNAAIYDQLCELKVGEALVFGHDEWHTVNHPTVALIGMSKTSKRFKGMKFSSKKLDKDWFVKRIK